MFLRKMLNKYLHQTKQILAIMGRKNNRNSLNLIKNINIGLKMMVYAKMRPLTLFEVASFIGEKQGYE